MINKNKLIYLSVIILIISVSFLNTPRRHIITYVIEENKVIESYNDLDANKIEIIISNMKSKQIIKVSRDKLNFMEISKKAIDNEFDIHIQYWDHGAYYDELKNNGDNKTKNVIENYYWWNWPEGKKLYIKFHREDM